MLLDYVPRSYLQFFYVVAFVVSVSQLKKLWHVNILLGWILLLSCWRLGGAADDGRFWIPSSLFYANSNELALGLVIAITQFMLLLYSHNKFARAAGLAGIAASLFYMLKTGSRGCTLALVALTVVGFLASRQKLKMAIITVPIALVVLLLMPSASLHRLTLMGLGDTPESGSDISAIALEILFGARRGHECMTIFVVNNLGVDMIQTAKDAQTRFLSTAQKLFTDPGVNRASHYCLRIFCHFLLLLPIWE